MIRFRTWAAGARDGRKPGVQRDAERGRGDAPTSVPLGSTEGPKLILAQNFSGEARRFTTP
jgi:hypothetical protein